MTEVIAEDGSTQETNLPAEAVADLQAAKPAEPAIEPAKVAEPSQKPADPAPAEAEKPKVDPAPAAEPEKPREKPKPIATLLNKKYEAEQRAQTLETENQTLKQQLEQLAA